MSNKNPFSDLFNSWTSNLPNAAESFDWDKLINASRLNAKAFSDAAKAAAEGAQALSRRQAEILQNNAEEISKFFKEISTSVKNPEAGVAKQAEFAKSSIESAISNSKELVEMAVKSNAEANDIITKRISVALTELAANSNTKKKKTDAA